MISKIKEDDGRVRYDFHINGKNVAYLIVRQYSSEGDGPWISGIYTIPGWRGYGLARKLVQQVEEDYEGETLRLRASPYKDAPKGLHELVALYEYWGFELYDCDFRMKKEL